MWAPPPGGTNTAMQRWPPLDVGVNTITFTLKLKLQAIHSIEPPQPTEWLGRATPFVIVAAYSLMLLFESQRIHVFN